MGSLVGAREFLGHLTAYLGFYRREEAVMYAPLLEVRGRGGRLSKQRKSDCMAFSTPACQQRRLVLENLPRRKGFLKRQAKVETNNLSQGMDVFPVLLLLLLQSHRFTEFQDA